MRTRDLSHHLATALLGAAMGLGALPAQAQVTPVAPPPWAYPALDAAVPAPKDDGTLYNLPGSKLHLTITQLFDTFKAWDWFPQEHPPMPDVVEHGRQPDVRACGMCHLPTGQGRPENAALAGLPAAYIEQQMADWKAGLRKSSNPKIGPQIRMHATAVAATDDEIRQAAAYFAGLSYRPWVRVVESASAPRSEVVIGSMYAAVKDGGQEPIGQRIVEIPQDLHRTELRDTKAGFVAYVPPGSLQRGERIVMTGGDGKVPACTTCHGPELKGLGNIPPIAGRSPSYLVRQMVDIQSGHRAGAAALPMKEVVSKLNLDDMIAIAAYVASRTP